MSGRIQVSADPTVPSSHRSTLTRRRLLQAGAGAAALAAGGASPSWAATRGVPAIQGEPIELTYWHGWTEQWSEMVQFVVDQFHQKQSRIRIKPEIVSSAELLTKLTAAIAAGEPPDVVTLFGSTAIPTLANEEAIVALDDQEGYDKAGVEAWMDPNVLKLGQYQDKTYGLSYWAGCYALMWNKAHFTEGGLDPNLGPTTIADLDAMADKLTVRDAGGEITRLAFVSSDLWLWGTVFGGSFYDPDGNKITANDANNVRALAWIRSKYEKYDPRKINEYAEGLGGDRSANLDPFVAGNYSMMMEGPWKLGDLRKFADPGFQFGIVPVPRETVESPSANWTWGDIQVIPEGSKDPAAAAEFVKFTAGVGDPEGYAQRVVWGNRPINVPVSRSVLEVPSFQQVVKEYPGFDVFVDALLNSERVGSPPVIPVSAFYNDRLTAAIERVTLLQEEPQPALDKVTEEVQRELDRAS